MWRSEGVFGGYPSLAIKMIESTPNARLMVQSSSQIALCASLLLCMRLGMPNGTNVEYSWILRVMTGVPRILTVMETMASAGSTAELEGVFGPYAKYMEDSRININVRQVY